MKPSTILAAAGCLSLAGCPHTPSGPTLPDATYQQKLTDFATVLTNGNPVPNITIVPAPAAYPIGAVLDARFTGSPTDKLNDCAIPPAALSTLTLPALPPLANGNNFNFTLSLPQSLSAVLRASIGANAVNQVSLGFDQLQETAPIRDPFEAAIASPACRTIIAGRDVAIVAGTVSGIESYSITANQNANLQLTLGSDPLLNVSGGNGPGQPITIAEKSPAVHFLILYSVAPLASAATIAQSAPPTLGAAPPTGLPPPPPPPPEPPGKIPPPPQVTAALSAALTRQLAPPP